MKKQYTYLAFLFCMLFSFVAQSQNCRIIKDSVSAGHDASAYKNYHYDIQNKLVKVDFIDSASMTINSYDTLIYTTSDLVDKVESISLPNATIDQSVRFTYDTNDKLIRIFETGTNMNGTWARAFDLAYHPSGLLSDMNLDPNSIVGNPEGFNASFKNISWINGNLMFVHIMGDLGAGYDTLELEVLSDSKNNVNKMLYINEAPDLLMQINTNNILELTFLYNETMGPVGTIALKNTFTYNADNNVETWTEHPAVFDDKNRTTNFTYDCTTTTGIASTNKNSTVNVFPNPFMSSLEINFNNMTSATEVKGIIKDINGKTVAEKTETISDSKMAWEELDGLANGYYLLQLIVNGEIHSYKLLKN